LGKILKIVTLKNDSIMIILAAYHLG